MQKPVMRPHYRLNRALNCPLSSLRNDPSGARDSYVQRYTTSNLTKL